MKPKNFKNHLTISEMAEFCGRDVSRIRTLEKAGKIPKAARVKVGDLKVRLWSPEQAEEAKHAISLLKVGRPRNDA